MSDPITNKRQMYALLNAGRLGNTLPRWGSVGAWRAAGVCDEFPAWGVQTATGGGGPYRLHCPTAEVQETCDRFTAAGHQVWISAMVQTRIGQRLMADVTRFPDGLFVRGIVNPTREAEWRRDMPVHARTYQRTAAKLLLDWALNENSRDDLEILLDRYPDHIVELTAYEKCYGTKQGRNAVTWEVRRY